MSVRDFSSVAPYLRDPLVLIGFFLFLGFLFSRYLIQRGVIPALPPSLGFRILKTILLYGFVVGLTLIVLGFLLKYKELQATQAHAEAVLREQQLAREAEEARVAQDRADHLAAARKRDEEIRKEKENTVRLMKTELVGNLKIVNELRKNTETLLTLFTETATVLRRPGIEIFTVLFSQDNLSAKPAASPNELSQVAFDALVARGLNNNALEQQKFTAAASLIAGTVDRTLPTIQSLRDPAHARYVPKSEIWDHNQDILRTLVADVTPFQQSYASLQSLRANYDIVCDRVVDYESAVREFMRPPEKKVTRESLTKVLATERLAISLTGAYGNEIVTNISTLRTLSKTVGTTKTETSAATRSE
jgi:hypothetical protein